MEKTTNGLEKNIGNIENHQNDIDLYDLIGILLKHKMTIFVTAVIIVLVSAGGAYKSQMDFNKNEKARLEKLADGEEKVQKTKEQFERSELIFKKAVIQESEKYSTAEGVAELIKMKYPELIRAVKIDEAEYNASKHELQVLKTPGKSKTKLLLVAGMILGIFSGIFMAFIKEFIDGYRRREKKN